MKTKQSCAQAISQFSSFSELHKDELIDVSDEAINSAYNYFDAERMKYYHNVHVKTDRNFRKKKDSKPSEWNDFASVIRICKKNNFHLRCYIKYCFINKLVSRGKGKTLSDIVYLRNYPQVIEYARNKSEIERLYGIYNSIIKTIFLIKKMRANSGESANIIIKKIINSGKLSEYVSTGMISPYFLALIHNIIIILRKYTDKFVDDNVIINDMSKRMEKYGKDSIKSMNMFYPSSLSKTVIQLCQE